MVRVRRAKSNVSESLPRTVGMIPASHAIRRAAAAGRGDPLGVPAVSEGVEEGLMTESDDDGVPAAAFTITRLGVSGGMAGHLHEGFGGGSRGFGEQVTFGVGFCGGTRRCFGDDEAGFGIP
jgi:hypothetical protein